MGFQGEHEDECGGDSRFLGELQQVPAVALERGLDGAGDTPDVPRRACHGP